MCLIRSIDSNMADLGLHITLLPISRQALPSSAATCQNQLLVLQIGLCLFLYVFPVFEHLSVLFCSVLLFLGGRCQGWNSASPADRIRSARVAFSLQPRVQGERHHAPLGSPRAARPPGPLALPLGPSVDELVKLVESAGAGRATAARAPQSVWEPVLARCCSAARCPLQNSPDPRRNRVGGWAKKARFACDARRGLLPCRPPDVS